MFSAGYSSYDPAILNEIFSRRRSTSAAWPCQAKSWSSSRSGRSGPNTTLPPSASRCPPFEGRKASGLEWSPTTSSPSALFLRSVRCEPMSSFCWKLSPIVKALMRASESHSPCLQLIPSDGWLFKWVCKAHPLKLLYSLRNFACSN